MPFGSFMAARGEGLPRRKKTPKLPKQRPVREKKPEMPQAAAEETMQFQEISSDSSKLHILLWGRTLSGIQDFLCALSENMSRGLHDAGMTCYTTELETITEISDRKKRLERYFWEFSKTPWGSAGEQTGGRSYTFTISPSGNQDKTLDLVFHCRCYEETSGLPGQSDAVWYLTDGAVLDPQVGYDAYRDFIRDGLQTAGADRPVCLVLAQIESMGHFKGVGERSALEPELDRKLLESCRSLFSCPEGIPVAVIPVQVYGGLEYTGTDEHCNPLLRLSQSGYYQSYIPENCQIPALYTIDTIARSREMDYLAGGSCGGMKQVIHRHLMRKTGETDWKPNLLREVAQQ